ncbi:hypothetical protein TRP8649_04333 [Pelagimonas phthalicica]|uniref:Lipopolysaccharide assembly protein A domain-containing protein n=1 Tax=Pelagimonas phthalicica TaxID=1037362 RepID=A0A238JHP5_9RHOB|nr:MULTISPECIES: LapA family protein [Roseobacteraceae]MBO9465532.1 LapA family protein [Tropicibacter sp. R15_0]TDS90023.1 uncharacterized protein DUF1049 [Pelagimonas phthalicica]SMX30191.1 hypothetical protein TRP8649_04333 [Pelagimonas phthalicica]
MRYIRYAFYAALAVLLVTVSLANRDMVTLNTLPEAVAAIPGVGWLSQSVEVPLFIVVLGSLILGVLLGEVLEWLREHKHRADAAQKGAQVRKLERELKKTQAERDKDKDEVLALLDQAS